jgi:hypothetical protein
MDTMVARAGAAAGFPFLIHSHMLRHSCGYKLANGGHDTRAIQGYLGHEGLGDLGCSQPLRLQLARGRSTSLSRTRDAQSQSRAIIVNRT